MSEIDFKYILGQNWKNIGGDKVDILQALSDYDSDESLIIHIGTDAQRSSRNHCDYAVCVCVHQVGKGGRVFYLKFKNIDTNSLWEKLYKETLLSLQVACDITEANSSLGDRILVHVDANPDSKYASSDHVRALAGMVMGYGFKHVLKPDSWASSHCADHIAKNKHLRK